MKDKFEIAMITGEEFLQASYDFNASAEIEAANRGLRIVYPEDNQLQLDIDSQEAYEVFQTLFRELGLDSIYEVTKTESASASGLPHRHITITLQEYSAHGSLVPYSMTEGERIAFQLALGSDPVREFLNLKRLIYGTKRPTRLFETKEEVNAL